MTIYLMNLYISHNIFMHAYVSNQCIIGEKNCKSQDSLVQNMAHGINCKIFVTDKDDYTYFYIFIVVRWDMGQEYFFKVTNLVIGIPKIFIFDN